MKRCTPILILLVFTIQVYGQEYDRWFIKKSNGNLGFINSLGNEIFFGKFDILSEHYYSGLVLFKRNSEYGYMDVNGNVVFTTDKYLGWFSENFLAVEDEGNFYYLDTLGQKVIALTELEIPNGKKIYKACNFYDGLALVMVEDYSYGFIDKTGKWFIEPIFQHATSFVEGVAYVVKEDKSYFMDTEGNFIAQLDRKNGEIWQSGDSDLFDFSEGFAVVHFRDSIGFSTSFINRKGERISSIMFSRAHKFSDGMAAAQLMLDDDRYVFGNWGFIDTTGYFVIQPQYNIRSDFREGLAPVYSYCAQTGASGQHFIDKTGAIAIPFQPNVSYGGFKGGLTKGRRFIYENKRYTGKYEFFYMNKNGEKIWSEIVEQ